MKFKIIVFFLIFTLIKIYCDESEDLSWIKNNRIRFFSQKMNKIRKEIDEKYFFSGEINIGFFYHFDNTPGKNNIGQFGYQNRDYTDKKYYNDFKGGYKDNDPIGTFDVLGLNGNFSFKVPFINSNHPIFTKNNIEIKLNWEFDWLQASTGFDFIISPFPFYFTKVKFNIGTGWDWLWDNNGTPLFSGMGLNSDDIYSKNGFISKPVLGPVINTGLYQGIQMDISALPLPQSFKRWTHIIVTASAGVDYQYMYNLDNNSSYNYFTVNNYMNGWSFVFSALLGYQIPVIQDNIEYKSFRRIINKKFEIFIASYFYLFFSLTHYADLRIKDNGWGSDFNNIKLNPMIIFNLPYNYRLILFFEFKNDIQYTENTTGNLYFKDRIYEDWFMKFEKIGIIFGWLF